MRKIYVASSWRCPYQQPVVHLLRVAGHEVYDFRHPAEGQKGFAWSDLDAAWQNWSPDLYVQALSDDIAEKGFALDWDAMEWADTCVLVLPCGRSAHIEAGYFVGAKKELYILIIDPCEPELMYKMATAIHTSLAALIAAIQSDPALLKKLEERTP